MKKIILVVLLILIPFISGLCEEGQIDINSASLEELDKLHGIGPAKSQAIIDTRPFNSIEDLINVYGIGNKTLEKIKGQELACVDKSENKNDDDDDELDLTWERVEEEDKNPENFNKKTLEEVNDKTMAIKEKEEKEINTTPEAIKITPKDINNKENNKTDREIKESKSGNYAVYVLIGFCVLLAVLFGFKLTNKKYKTEFDKNE